MGIFPLFLLFCVLLYQFIDIRTTNDNLMLLRIPFSCHPHTSFISNCSTEHFYTATCFGYVQ